MAQAYDLEEVLNTVTFLEGRTIHTDTKGTFAWVVDCRESGIVTRGFPGTSQWDRRSDGGYEPSCRRTSGTSSKPRMASP